MGMIAQQRNSAFALAPGAAPHIELLGSFAVWKDGRRLQLRMDAQRLLAFLALRHNCLPRAYVAETLWMDGTRAQAFGSLRSALWRLRARSESLVDADSNTLALSSHVSTDVQESAATASRLFDRSDRCDGMRFEINQFASELLPGWYDEWVILDRERIRQQSLHALESIAFRLADEQQFAAAIEAALAAISLDPLRESAHRCLVSIHLKEGNRSEAIHHFEQFERDLRERLGITPSERMQALMT